VNLGINENYNLTFNHSRGEYFKWAACNDVCAPALIERCIEVLDARRDVVLCYGRTGLLLDQGGASAIYDDQLDLQQEDPRIRFREFLKRVHLNNVMNGIMRVQALRQTTLLGTYLSSDIVLMAELVLHGKFVELPEQLFFRRMLPGASTKYKNEDELIDCFDPVRRKPLLFQHWKLHWGYCAAGTRPPLAARVRVGVYADLLRRVFWARKNLARDVYIAVRNRLLGPGGRA
jgi:hypothetical protein